MVIQSVVCVLVSRISTIWCLCCHRLCVNTCIRPLPCAARLPMRCFIIACNFSRWPSPLHELIGGIVCDGCLPACWSGCWVCVNLAVANVHLLAGLGIGKVCIGPFAPMAAPVESVPVAPCAVAAPGDARVASTVRGLLGVGAPKSSSWRSSCSHAAQRLGSWRTWTQWSCLPGMLLPPTTCGQWAWRWRPLGTQLFSIVSLSRAGCCVRMLSA